MATVSTDWVSVSEACRILELHRDQVQRLIDQKQVTVYRVPASTRVKLKRSELVDLKRRSMQPKA
jgi:excisionase family DNA binding protein